jgi:hypothetical protein
VGDLKFRICLVFTMLFANLFQKMGITMKRLKQNGKPNCDNQK